MEKRFKMLAYTGEPLSSLFWGELIIDIQGISTGPRLPALRQHEPTRAVGVIDTIHKDREGLTAEGYFLSTLDGQECQSLLEQGYPMQASIGVWADTVEEVEKGKKALVNGRTLNGPAVIWRTSHVREISFASLGMDKNTSVSIAASAEFGQEWEASADLRREFGQLETYLAFKRAEKAGLTSGCPIRTPAACKYELHNLEASALEEWDINPGLHQEFRKIETYLAWCRASAAGLVSL